MKTHDFCRAMLTETMVTVRKHTTAAERKAAGIGISEFYWYGGACCLYDARTKGWDAYLSQKGESADDPEN